jgi:hypothetical protein
VVDFARSDSGRGSLNDYSYGLVPKKASTVIQLAGSDQYRGEIEKYLSVDDVQAFVSRRTLEEERTDAPIAVRLFVDRGMSGIVGWVPRGLEPAVLEAIARLEEQSKTVRIPVAIIAKRGALRVELLMGLTR